jgi:hypothetical protein
MWLGLFSDWLLRWIIFWAVSARGFDIRWTWGFLGGIDGVESSLLGVLGFDYESSFGSGIFSLPVRERKTLLVISR